MTVIALTNAYCYAAGYDLTADSNNILMKTSVESKDRTTFRSSGYRERLGGLKSVELSVAGFYQSAATQSVDSEMFPALGTADQVFTVANAETETGPAYMFQAGKFDYSPMTSPVGDIAGFTASAFGTNSVGAVRGQLAKAMGSVSATGQLGSGLLLGAPTGTQYVYAALHVFTAATTITVQIQSDDNAGFSSPTTRGTIGPVTVSGGTWMTRVAGPFSGETYWRANVSAITGTFVVACAIGVQ